MARTLVRRIVKTIFFIIITFVVARSFGSSEAYINHDIASKLALFISGDINAESIYDAYFYIDITSVFSVAIIIYIIVIKLINKIRNK